MEQWQIILSFVFWGGSVLVAGCILKANYTRRSVFMVGMGLFAVGMLMSFWATTNAQLPMYKEWFSVFTHLFDVGFVSVGCNFIANSAALDHPAKTLN